MKRKALIIATIIFFLSINTQYFWEGKLGLLAFPALTLLFIFYVILALMLGVQVFILFKEKFNDKKRLSVSLILLIVLTLAFFKPGGFIDLDKLSGNDLLIAVREGAANCTTTLRLKDSNKFSERSICFGVTDIKGHYEVKDDTIFFTDVVNYREGTYYSYAVIKPDSFQNEKISGELILYKDMNDSIGHELFITKNDLIPLAEKNSSTQFK